MAKRITTPNQNTMLFNGRLIKKFLLPLATFIVISTSFILSFHNASLYNPLHGLDGEGHLYNVKYIYKYNQIPPVSATEVSADTNVETHQPPLYYLLVASIYRLTNNIKSVQFFNPFVLWSIVLIVGYGLKKVLKNKGQVLLGMLSLAALPMLNIFPPMITNEFLSTFFIISTVIACVCLQLVKNQKQFYLTIVWLILSLVLAVWTKISVVIALPTVLLSLLLARKTVPVKAFIVTVTIVFASFALAYLPIYLRANRTNSPSDLGNNLSAVTSIKTPRSLDFYLRLDWIFKPDMYTTQYYSLLGGAWNSFWSDGHNVLTPFVPFHKKAFVLWSLGFVLLPISLFGLYRLYQTHRKPFIVVFFTGSVMLAIFVLHNTITHHYSANRLTYEMAIVVPYAFGIASAAKSKRMKIIVSVLLLIQFITLVSFYWIQPWWFQAT